MFRLMHALLGKNSSWLWVKPCAALDPAFPHRLSHQLYGPDQIVPSKELHTTKPDGYVKIRREGEGVSSLPAISVPGLLHLAATKHPDTIALESTNAAGELERTTYRQYEEEVRTCAKAFLKLGLERFHSVCIIGYNARGWIISDLAAIYAGGFATGMYTTSTPKACFLYAESSRANIIVVQDEEQLIKILEIKDKLPLLKAIVQYEGVPSTPGVISWKEILKMGNEQSDDELEKILRHLAVNECCTLIYTSGTTGNPKAVMLSHDNLTWNGRMISQFMEGKEAAELIVSYLPLSHIAAQIVDIYLAMACCGTIHFGDKNALKGSLVHTLREAKPTVFLAVPRVWEKMSEKILFEMGRVTGWKKYLVLWAQKVSLQHYMAVMQGKGGFSLQYALAYMLVFGKLKKNLGFERCRIMLNGAAPLSTDIKLNCWSISLMVMEGFGMSETAGCHTLCKEDAFRLESVGLTLPGCHTKIDQPDESGQGELVFSGRNIFMGYMNDIPSTESSFDAEEWFHSGDIGTIDELGFVYITGRAKEVVITAGGENIPPVVIEGNIRAELPCISAAVLVGDYRRFLSVLLTMKCERDESGDALDDLDLMARKWCESIGSPATKVSQAVHDEYVLAAIHEGIDRANTKVLSHAQRVQKFALLPKGFSLSTGEMGPTLKLKRKAILEKYSDVIDAFYKDELVFKKLP